MKRSPNMKEQLANGLKKVMMRMKKKMKAKVETQAKLLKKLMSRNESIIKYIVLYDNLD